MPDNQNSRAAGLQHIIALFFCLAVFVVPGYANQKRWTFDVFLDDLLIGTHQYVVAGSDSNSRVISEANYRVRFMFITVYHYRHRSEERWQGSCLAEIKSKTDDNGDDYQVTGKVRQGEFVWTTGQSIQKKTDCTRTFAYWDFDVLASGQLLNSQTGELVDIAFTGLGQDTLNIAKKRVLAQKYQLSGKEMQIQLWYSMDGHWLALESTLPEGQVLSYRLHEFP